jgi:choline dehydrogenase-like flavoprotein
LLLSTPPPADRTFDLCVIGAGPVGLSLALEARGLGLDVLLIEAGPPDATRSLTGSDPADATIAYPTHHAAVTDATSRGVGGTSRLWGGKCVPFEPIDFEHRPFVLGSGWPIKYFEIARWHQHAAAYLQCGHDFYSEDPAWPDLGRIQVRQHERWSRHRLVADSLGGRVIADPAIALLSHATVTDLVLEPDDTASHAQVLVGGASVPIRARQFAIACGGLKTTRLLLHMQRRRPSLLGGPSGPLGRNYAGHLTGSIADIVLTSAEAFRPLGLRLDADGTYVRRRFTIAAVAQREQHLLNTAFYLSNPPFHDHRHGSGALSALFLAMRVPLLGERLALRETRERNRGLGWRSYVHHLRNIGRRPLRTAGDLTPIIRRRLFSAQRMSVFVVPNERGVYALRYHAEQTCRPDNRVYLNDRESADGLMGIEIAFRYSDQDIDSVVRAHALLDQRLRVSGRGRLAYHDMELARPAAVLAQASDGFHQIGTTRMSDDPTTGVVDKNCQLHGLRNVFVTSSSVFPTAGEANPTFTAVCLAIRLAHHLSDARRATG